MINSFKLLLYIMKLNLKRINSFKVSILVTSSENRTAEGNVYFRVLKVSNLILRSNTKEKNTFILGSITYLHFMTNVVKVRTSLIQNVPAYICNK